MAVAKEEEYAKQMKEAATPKEAPQQSVPFANSGGCLVVVDWDEKRVMAVKPFGLPLGFAFDPEDHQKLWVTNWEKNEFHLLHGNEVIQRIAHPHFCHIHTVHPIPGERRLLVTSSGTDFVAELAIDAAPGDDPIVRKWVAMDHGYPTPEGQPQGLIEDADYTSVWWSCAK